MQIRTPRDTELDAVGLLVRGVYVDEGYVDPAGAYQATLADARGRVDAGDMLVAADGDRLLGTLVFCPPGARMGELAAADEAEFRMLAVSPDARGHGVATALIRTCIDRSHALGLHRLVLMTLADMADAQRLYRRLGFVRVPARDLHEPDLGLLAFALTLPPP